MAAEKLTKKRFIQILLVLCILLGAFFYRTWRHAAQAESAVESGQVLKTEEK